MRVCGRAFVHACTCACECACACACVRVCACVCVCVCVHVRMCACACVNIYIRKCGKCASSGGLFFWLIFFVFFYLCAGPYDERGRLPVAPARDTTTGPAQTPPKEKRGKERNRKE